MTRKEIINDKKSKYLRFPVLAHGAESLVQGYLMRRNILTYQAPRHNEGYDLICMHPDPRGTTKTVKVQVKSRYQTDCDRSIIVPRKSDGAFDFVIAVFLNVGYFYRTDVSLGKDNPPPEFFTLPASWIDKYRSERSSWGKVHLKQKDIERFKDERGFDQIANYLKIGRPARHNIRNL